MRYIKAISCLFYVIWWCVSVWDFEKRDMFCLSQHVFRRRFLLVTRTDAFGGLSCAGMCENVCAFMNVCVFALTYMCVCVCLIRSVYLFACLCDSFSICLFSYCLCVLFHVCLSAHKCIACLCVCVSVCQGVCVCAWYIHRHSTVYLRLERTEKNNTLQ